MTWANFSSSNLEVGSLADWFAGFMSALAVIVALGGYWLGASSARRDRRARLRESAHRLLIKLITMANGLYTLSRYIENDAKKEALAGPDGVELWRMVQPLMGFADSDEVQIDASEATLLIELKEIDFLMDVMLLAKRNGALISSMREYGVRREALATLTPTHVSFRGQIGTVEFTTEEYLRVRPYSIALESLIQNIRSNCVTDLTAAKRLTDAFGPMMRKRLRDKTFPVLEQIKGANEKIYQTDSTPSVPAA